MDREPGTRSVKRRRVADPDKVYESGRQLVQRHFPSRRRTTHPNTRKESILERKKYQTTLTQIDFVHNVRDLANIDQELFGTTGDTFNIAKRQKLALKPKHPQVSTNKERTPSSSFPKKRNLSTPCTKDQQTLTQGDYLTKLVCTDESSDAHTFMRNEGELRSIRDSRDSKVLPGSLAKLVDVPSNKARTRERVSTPTIKHRAVVPSSQSPEEEDSLVKRRVSVSETSRRSPLRERSTNTALPTEAEKANSRQHSICPSLNPANSRRRLRSRNLDRSNMKLSPISIRVTPKRMDTVQDSDSENVSEGEQVLSNTNTASFMNALVRARRESLSFSNHEPETTRSSRCALLPQPNWSKLDERQITQILSSPLCEAQMDCSNITESQQLLFDAPQMKDLDVKNENAHLRDGSPSTGTSSTQATDTSTQSMSTKSSKPLNSSPMTTISDDALKEPLMFEQVLVQPKSPKLNFLETTGVRPRVVEQNVECSSKEAAEPPGGGCVPYGVSDATSIALPEYIEPKKVTFSQLVPESLRDNNITETLGSTWTEDEEL